MFYFSLHSHFERKLLVISAVENSYLYMTKKVTFKLINCNSSGAGIIWTIYFKWGSISVRHLKYQKACVVPTHSSLSLIVFFFQFIFSLLLQWSKFNCFIFRVTASPFYHFLSPLESI